LRTECARGDVAISTPATNFRRPGVNGRLRLRKERAMQSEPTRKDPKQSAISELKAIAPWFLIPVAIILILLGFILFAPRNEAEAHRLVAVLGPAEAHSSG
jgi:hypothetical protein